MIPSISPNHRSHSLFALSLLFSSWPASDAFTTNCWRPSAYVTRPSALRLQMMLRQLKNSKEKDLISTEAIANGFFDPLKTRPGSGTFDADSSGQQNLNLAKISPVDKVDVAMIAAVIGAGFLAVATILLTQGSGFNIPSPNEIIALVDRSLADPTAALRDVVTSVESMGPLGALYFGAVYTVAEILAIPAFPLTASAGYLFGVAKGTSIVLASASVAATVSFVIGRTLLRSYVEKLLLEFPQFQKIDKAIGKEGFKLMLLLRLSPVFPFALSNYLYGASSVGFLEYFFGTMIGFTPGTIAYVYGGEVGKALTLGGGDTQPLYVYGGGFVLLAGFLKILGDVATGIIEEVNDE